MILAAYYRFSSEGNCDSLWVAARSHLQEILAPCKAMKLNFREERKQKFWI